MKSQSRRRYRMQARSAAAEQTGRAILAATVELWRAHPLDEITLQAIAERAGVSVQTVIRRFGSKEGVVAAGIAQDAAGIRSERDQVAVGDVAGALQTLLRHYERDGDAVLRTLAIEARLEVARAMAEAGRATHRAWCARVFAPYLPPPASEHYTPRLDAFVAATDLSLWKLLRRDLGRSAAETEQALRLLLRALIALPADPS